MRPPVIIFEYDRQWPILYEEERGRILLAVGQVISAIEHVGSTAVPGLGAKPIVDIMGGVRNLADAVQCIEPLQAIGYQYEPESKIPSQKDAISRKVRTVFPINTFTCIWSKLRAIFGSTTCFSGISCVPILKKPSDIIS